MTAARALGIGRSKAHQLASTGEFPCRIIRIGTHYNVPTVDLLKVLGVTPVPLPRGTTENRERETPSCAAERNCKYHPPARGDLCLMHRHSR
jgi:hypothetical protein